MTDDCFMWGKTTSDGNLYPLIAHLADTAAAATALWAWFAPNVQGVLSKVVNTGSDAAPTTARTAARFALIAASHDLGKANPFFQGQTRNSKRAMFEPHMARLEQAGFDFPTDIAVTDTPSIRHESFTFHHAPSIGLPEWAATAAAGHHGTFHKHLRLAPDKTQDHHIALRRTIREIVNPTSRWGDVVSDAYNTLSEALNVSFDDTRLATADHPGLLLLTGAISLADWLASADRSVAHGAARLDLLDEDPARYITSKAEWFASELSGMLGHHIAPAGTFNELFNLPAAASPTRMQTVTGGAGPEELCVVMAPMGTGKTEAALLRTRNLSRGMYFALPTQATSDAMFARVANFYASAGPQAATLAHSRAVLNSFYDDNTTWDATRGLQATTWFRGPHRALLAPVAVGTVDQALKAALPHRYLTMRLLALASKHVVIDEVHTLDPYQDVLMSGLLEWLGYCNTPTTLLSATLPAVRLARYLDSWAAGTSLADRPPERDQARVTVAYPAVVTASTTNTACTTWEPEGLPKRIDVRTVKSDDTATAVVNEIRAVLTRWAGAAVGVIVNRVDTAIAIGAAVADLDPIVLHSRMTANQRADRTAAVMGAVGKHRAGARVVVGTQVIEASLDVDFDILITELAPAPSLLQRTGRLWRHSNPTGDGWDHPAQRAANRPTCPVCVVIAPAEIKPRAALPYTAAELTKTARVMLNGGQWTIPDDVQRFVDDADVNWDDLDGEDADLAADHLAGDAARTSVADSRRNRLDDITRLDHARFAALTSGNPETLRTRWDDELSFTIIAAGTSAGCFHGLRPTRSCDRAAAHTLLGFSVPVSGRIARLLEDQPELDEDVHPLLTGLRFVDLDRYATLRLDPCLGLVD